MDIRPSWNTCGMTGQLDLESVGLRLRFCLEFSVVNNNYLILEQLEMKIMYKEMHLPVSEGFGVIDNNKLGQVQASSI